LIGGYIAAGFDRVVYEDVGREHKVGDRVILVIGLKLLGVDKMI
jgi:hypothetical protein